MVIRINIIGFEVWHVKWPYSFSEKHVGFILHFHKLHILRSSVEYSGSIACRVLRTWIYARFYSIPPVTGNFAALYFLKIFS